MVYVFLADGFEEIEALTTVDILRRAEIETLTVGVGGISVVGSHGIKVSADILDSEAVFSDLEMIILPGGMPGTLNLEACETVNKFIDYSYKNNLWIAAICAAPSILGHKGLLREKRAVCYPGFENHLEGATVCDKQVVVDGKIITARGMGAALDFSIELLSLLKGKDTADKMQEAICKI